MSRISIYDLEPHADIDYRYFPAPFSMSGCRMNDGSFFGLSRGVIANFELNGRSSADYVDAKDNGEFDDDLGDLKIARLNENRRTNLACSLMSMPAYFHSARRMKDSSSFSCESTYGVDYETSDDEVRIDFRVMFDWSIDNSYPGPNRYSFENSNPDFDYSLHYKLIVVGFRSPFERPNVSSFIEKALSLSTPEQPFLGIVDHHAVTGHEVTPDGTVIPSYEWNIIVAAYFESADFPIDPDNILDSLYKTYDAVFPHSDRTSILDYRGGFEINTSVFPYDIFNTLDFSFFRLSSDGTPWNTASWSTSYSEIHEPFENWLVSPDEFRCGIESFEDGQSSDVLPQSQYKWYAHVFDPDASFSWVRSRPEWAPDPYL